MKAYVKKNLVESGNGRFIVPGMRKLEGSIIDVVWSAGDKGELPGWRTESSPWYFWNDDWLMILPEGYDLGKAVTVLLHWYDEYKQVNERRSKRAGDDALTKIKISKLEKEIRDLTSFNDGLRDTIAQKDSVLLNIQDRIDWHYKDAPPLA